MSRTGCPNANLNLILKRPSSSCLVSKGSVMCSRNGSQLTYWTALYFLLIQSETDWFDSTFSFSKHVRTVCKSSFVHLRDFRRIRRFLTHNAPVLVANALVGSRLDYCYSLFRSLSKSDVGKLQCIQNSAARIVTNTSRYTSITLLKSFTG